MDKYFKKFTFHPKLYASSFPGDAKERNILLWERNNARLRWNTHGPEEPFWFLGSYKLIASNCPEQISLSWQHWQWGPDDAGCGDCPVHCRVFTASLSVLSPLRIIWQPSSPTRLWQLHVPRYCQPSAGLRHKAQPQLRTIRLVKGSSWCIFRWILCQECQFCSLVNHFMTCIILSVNRSPSQDL